MMAGSGTSRPQAPKPQSPKPQGARPEAAEASRKPPLVLHISRREEQERLAREAAEARAVARDAEERAGRLEAAAAAAAADGSAPDVRAPRRPEGGSADDPDAGLTMADLLAADTPRDGGGPGRSRSAAGSGVSRSVDDFDFDEEAFLAALAENEPVGATGEVVAGTVIGQDGDGVYVDIGGKAPGFMPRRECGLGVMTNLRERFPKGLAVEVLVTGEQNADGMVSVSCRALELRRSWEKVRAQAAEGAVVQVRVNGFNRGGVTCDLEGLRGFIPRSQLSEGDQHESLVGRTLGVTFLEVNPDTRKLVLSEKRAASAARFSELEVGQLVEGHVASVKPYGLFVDLGGVSGLLHLSCISGAPLRTPREAFDQGDAVKALITELDPGRGRIALNTALLESRPGELLEDREAVMAEAADRANRARTQLRQREQEAG